MEEPEGTLGDYCAPFDALSVVGGGTLTDTFAWGLIQRSALVRTFAMQQKPVVLTGQQIGPFASSHSRRLTTEALRAASFVGLREPTASLDHARAMRLRQYELMGDDSLGLTTDTERTAERLQGRGLRPGQFFAVNVRIGFYAAEHATHLERIGGLVRRLAERSGLPALVVPVALGGKTSDVQSGYVLQEQAGDLVQVLDDEDLSASAVKGVMGLARGAVGVSYHFCTFALSQGVPAVCIHDGAYYGQKGDGIAAFWNEPRLSLPLPGLEAEAAAKRVEDVWNDTELRDALPRRAEEAQATWERTYVERVVPALRGGRDAGASPPQQ